MKTMTIDEIRELTDTDLAARLKKAASSVASTHILTGKLIFVMDEQRPEKGTLKAYVRAQTGMEIDSHAYKCASAFRLVGEGYGCITETDFDGCKLRWLITVSQILNVLADQKDDTFTAKTREAVAAILRKREETAGKLLEAIYQAIKPETKPETNGAGDGAGDGAAGEPEPGSALLTRAWYKEILAALSGCQDPEVLTLARDGFGSLSTIAGGMLEELTTEAAPALAAA